MDGQWMVHLRTVSWDPGIADSRNLLVCYDCLCFDGFVPDCDVFGSLLGRGECMDWA